jgi:hypothetical protein
VTCLHCGRTTLSREYSLRFTPEAREPSVLALQLCTTCLSALRREPDIELLAEPVPAAE